MLLRVGVLHRLLALLGGTLTLAALGCLREAHRYRGLFEIVDNHDLVYHLFYLVAAGLGVLAAWHRKRTLAPEGALRIAGAYLAALLAFEMLQHSLFERGRYDKFSEYLFFANNVLIDIAPALWGASALLRCQDPLDPRARRLSRMFSILLTIGLAVKLYDTFSNHGYYSTLHYLIANLEPRRLFMTSLRCLPLIFLLRGIVEELRPSRSPLQAGRRARTVFWALLGWYLSHAGWWAYEILYSMLLQQSYGRLFWTGLLTHALLALIGLATFLGLAKPEPEAATVG